ncbi:MAG: MFS transporter [Candidatus Omnitrophica bacterium]|nr:MFS transporter [Candidatus Omnitrophota bacterium]MDE2009496.1 MFS transporter [Candidatus Omnitrophota bacterium]MDE2215098.1 MFS transporter [Candidatus Omnitrophota bacterium]MDE2232059.1 MFS transporter [Candidatus Omnitrophota bacterium]
MADVVEPSHHHVTASEDRIPVFQKIIYSIGALVNQMQAAALTAMVLVLNLGLGMDPAKVGIIGTVPRLFDAFSDPLIGYTSDNTRTRYGRRRPFMFWGAIVSGFLFCLLFQLHKANGNTFNFWYFIVIQCFFVVAFSFYSIPLIALGFEMTPDYHERTRLQGWGNTLGQLAWLVSPWLFKFMYSNADKDLIHGVRVLAVIFGVFILAGGVLPAIFNKEYFTHLPKPDKKSMRKVVKDFFGGCAVAFKNRPFVQLCIITFLIFNGFMLASAFTAYNIFFYDYGGDYGKGGDLLGWNGTASALVSFLIIFPLITKMATKLGKRNTLLITIPLSIAGYALKWWGYNQQHPYLLLFTAPLIAFSLGSLFTIVTSMLADVCDFDELQTGTRREGIFGAIYWWMIKLGQAAASLASGFLLNWTGFKESLHGHQSPHALLYMRLCDIGIPIVASLIAIYFILTFDISEDKAYNIRRQLEERRGKA